MNNKNKLGGLFKGLGVVAGIAGLAYAGYKATEVVNQKLKERNIVFAIKDLVSSIHYEKRATLDFDKLVQEEWERLYIFTPFTSYDDVYNVLGFEWEEVCNTDLNYKDSMNLLVFVKGQKVVKFIEYPKSYGDFSKLNSDIYIRENAKFELENNSGIITLHEKATQ